MTEKEWEEGLVGWLVFGKGTGGAMVLWVEGAGWRRLGRQRCWGWLGDYEQGLGNGSGRYY
jgi:hypothetical protein